MYRTCQQQMNDALAFGMAIMFMGITFGIVRSLVSETLRPDSEVTELLPQTTSSKGYTVFSQVDIEGGKRIPAEYRYLTGWLREPLPDYSRSLYRQ